jgi:hypothetical protein
MYQITLIKDVFSVVIHPDGGFADPRKSECVVFVCGALMNPDFTAGVIGRAAAVCPALAPGFARGYGEVGGKQIHFMRREPGGMLPGMAILGLTTDELKKLEAFEQCPNLRQKTGLEIIVGDAKIPAITYLQK